MRKIIILLFFSFLCTNVFSQEKKTSGNPYKFNIGLGTGVGIYGGKSNDKNTVDTNSVAAACILYNLKAEYSFIKTMAVGFSLERNGFLGAKDSSKSGTSFNLGITAKYRFVSRDFNNIYIELIPGFSHFTYQNTNNNQTNDVKSDGFNIQAGLGWEHYFNLHLGMNLAGYYSVYKYRQIVYINDGTPVQVNIPPEDLNITLAGLNLNVGLLYRF